MIYFRETAIARCYHVHSGARENWKVFTSPPTASAQQYLIQLSGKGAKKHEIDVAAFGGHLFMTYFYRADEKPPWSPGSATT